MRLRTFLEGHQLSRLKLTIDLILLDAVLPLPFPKSWLRLTVIEFTYLLTKWFRSYLRATLSFYSLAMSFALSEWRRWIDTNTSVGTPKQKVIKKDEHTSCLNTDQGFIVPWAAINVYRVFCESLILFVLAWLNFQFVIDELIFSTCFIFKFESSFARCVLWCVCFIHHQLSNHLHSFVKSQ